MGVSDRDFDIVIYGATSFTAKLCVRYLLQNYGGNGVRLKYALAGRDSERLDKVIMDLGMPLDTPIRLCDLTLSSLQGLARETTVIINFVGPYSILAGPVIEACVEEGTHYVDLSGELDWLEYIGKTYHQSAVERGVKIIPAMGFCFAPFDLGVACLHHATKGLWKGSEIVCTVDHGAIGVSSGTVETLVSQMMNGPIAEIHEKVVSTIAKNTFMLPRLVRNINLCSSVMYPQIAGYLEWLNQRYLMRKWSDGTDGNNSSMNITIGEEHKKGLCSIIKALFMCLVSYLMVGLMVIVPTNIRQFLISGGPSSTENGHVSSTFRFYRAEDVEQPRSVVNMSYNCGEGYQLSAMLCAEAALTIVFENSSTVTTPTKDGILPQYDLDERRGVGSGSSLLGSAYIQRLRRGGLNFEVL